MAKRLEDDDEFIAHVREQMIEPMKKSHMVATIWAGVVDWKISMEMGAAMLLDKPIILVIAPGTAIPAKLALVADDIVEGSMDDPKALAKSVAASLERLGIES